MTCRILLCSNSEHTQKIGEELAWELGAQLHEIDCQAADGGVWDRVKLGVHALLSRDPVQDVPDQPWDRSDMLILGTPDVNGRTVRPLRQWLESQPALPERIAFLVTSQGGDYPAATVEDLTTLTGQDPVAVLHVSDKDVESGAWKGRMEHFLDQCLIRYRQSA